MSTNIHIYGRRDILVVKTQRFEEQEIKFPAWQTSTFETHNIMSQDDKIQAYTDYILSRAYDRCVDVYDEDDIFCENPVDTRIVNDGKDHIKMFDDWLDFCETEGYTVVFEAW